MDFPPVMPKIPIVLVFVAAFFEIEQDDEAGIFGPTGINATLHARGNQSMFSGGIVTITLPADLDAFCITQTWHLRRILSTKRSPAKGKGS
jgi:hypothetical protein